MTKVSTILLWKTETKTTKMMQGDLNIFYRWAKETRFLENIPEQELDKVLAHFFLKVQKQNEEYEPYTLTSMLQSFDRITRTR